MTYFNDEFTFNKLKSHIGHHIECVPFGNEETGIVNVTICCETCNEVLCDCDKPEDMDYVDFPDESEEEPQSYRILFTMTPDEYAELIDLLDDNNIDYEEL